MIVPSFYDDDNYANTFYSPPLSLGASKRINDSRNIPFALPLVSTSSSRGGDIRDSEGNLRLFENQQRDLEIVENEVNNLINYANRRKGIDSVTSLNKKIYDWGTLFNQLGKQGSNPNNLILLQKVFPFNVFNSPEIQSNFKNVFFFFSSLDSFLNIVETGTTCLSLMYRKMILKKAKSAFDKIKQMPTKEVNVFISPQELLDWELNIHLEEEALHQSIIKYGIRTINTGLKIIAPLKNLLSTESFLIRHPMVLQSIGWVSGIFLIALSGKFLHQKVKEKRHFNSFVECFKNCVYPDKGDIIPEKIRKKHKDKFKLFLDELINEKRISDSRLFSDEEFLKDFPRSFIDQLIKYKNFYHQEYKKSPNELKMLLSNKREALLGQYILHLETKPTHSIKVAASYSKKLLDKRREEFKDKVDLLMIVQEDSTELKTFKKDYFDKNFNSLVEEIKSKKWNVRETRKLFEKFLPLEFTLALDNSKETDPSHYLEYLSNARDTLFTEWLSNPNQSHTVELITSYLHHQNTLSSQLINSLNLIMEKKLTLENNYFNFRFTESISLFTSSTITTALSIAVGVIGFTNPIGLLGLSVFFTASVLAGFGFMAVGCYLSAKKNPASWKSDLIKMDIKLKFNYIKSAIEKYKIKWDNKKFARIASKVDNLNPLAIHDHSTQITTSPKLEKIEGEVKRLQDRLSNEHWKDFAAHAQLKVNDDPELFDTFRAYKALIEQIDPGLFSDHHQKILNLNFNLSIGKLKEDKDSFINTLQRNANLSNVQVLSFIERHLALDRIENNS